MIGEERGERERERETGEEKRVVRILNDAGKPPAKETIGTPEELDKVVQSVSISSVNSLSQASTTC